MLKALLVDVLLIEDSQYRDEVGPLEVATWDSLALVLIAAAVEKSFGVVLDSEEVVSLESIGDIKAALSRHGVTFSA